LRPEQLWRLFVATLERNGMSPCEAEIGSLHSRLAGITTCTPGDFAAIVRRRKVIGPPDSAMDLVNDVEVEQLIKSGVPRQGIGFLAAINQ